MTPEDAREFAIQKHGQQKYGDKPYSYHLDKVAEIVKPYGPQTQIIAYLHDTLEDTETTIKELENKFSKSVAECVSLLSDEPGKNRKEQKALTYKKLKAVNDHRLPALIVKAADRLANLQACIEFNNTEKFIMYKMEHRLFKKAVFKGSLCDEIWIKIQHLVES